MDEQGEGSARTPPSDRVLFRIVKSNPATLADFLSHRAHHNKRAPERELGVARDGWDGVSFLITLRIARDFRRAMPRLGNAIAELEVRSDMPVELEPPDENGHLNAYAAPDILLGAISRYHEVE